jgi:hypothetical protein
MGMGCLAPSDEAGHRVGDWTTANEFVHDPAMHLAQFKYHYIYSFVWFED